MSVRLVILPIAGAVVYALVRLTGDRQAVVALAQPWRFLIRAAAFVSWFGTIATFDLWIGRHGDRRNRPTGSLPPPARPGILRG